MPTSTDHKVALITGGARGIGFGIAEALLQSGYRVLVTGLSDEEVTAVPPRDHLSSTRLDVTDDHAVADIISQCDQLDALVNCAGMILRGGAEYQIASFQKVMDVNLTGTMRMCIAAREKLAASGRGVIINTASIAAFDGQIGQPAYAASKGGIVGMTLPIAREVARELLHRVRARHRTGASVTTAIIGQHRRFAGKLFRDAVPNGAIERQRVNQRDAMRSRGFAQRVTDGAPIGSDEGGLHYTVTASAGISGTFQAS